MLDIHLGFIGCGQMAQALAGAMVEAQLVSGERICGFDVARASRDRFQQLVPKAMLAGSGREVLERCDVIVLAVKPQNVEEVLQELQGKATAEHLVISIAAGVSLKQLSAGFGEARLVRVMPNTPCLVRQGASAYALGPGATASDGQLVLQLLSAVGKAFAVEEKLLDAVTGLSGSGPAYVYVMIEALSDGGVRMGLPRPVATALAAQTVLGAAAMVLETGVHPGELKDRVASPGGTTIAGLQVLEQQAVRGALIQAVEAATRRATQLGEPRS